MNTKPKQIIKKKKKKDKEWNQPFKVQGGNNEIRSYSYMFIKRKEIPCVTHAPSRGKGTLGEHSGFSYRIKEKEQDDETVTHFHRITVLGWKRPIKVI